MDARWRCIPPIDRRLCFDPISERFLTWVKRLLHWALCLPLELKFPLAVYERLYPRMTGVGSSAGCDTTTT